MKAKAKIKQVTRLLQWLVATANGKADTHDNCDSERAYPPTPQRQDHILEVRVAEHRSCRMTPAHCAQAKLLASNQD
jgi:hypothetical protein